MSAGGLDIQTRMQSPGCGWLNQAQMEQDGLLFDLSALFVGMQFS